MNKLSQNGFSIIPVVLIIGVVGILAFAGYNVYSRTQDKKTTTSATTQSQNANTTSSDEVSQAPEIKDTKDLDAATKTLDSTNVESSNDDTQLNQDLAAF